MAHKTLVCPSCGNLRSVCSDPTRDWHPNTTTCWATATLEWGQRVVSERHKDKPLDGAELHPLDGVRMYVTEDAPEDDPLS